MSLKGWSLFQCFTETEPPKLSQIIFKKLYICKNKEKYMEIVVVRDDVYTESLNVQCIQVRVTQYPFPSRIVSQR